MKVLSLIVSVCLSVLLVGILSTAGVDTVYILFGCVAIGILCGLYIK